jgi:two-component system, OmpR family, sensor histidine kinase MprB
VSLRWKIALTVAGLAAVATLFVGAAGYRTTRDRLYAEVDRSLVDVVTVVPLDRGGNVVRLPVRGPLAMYEVQVIGPDGSVRLTTAQPAVAPSQAALRVVGRPRLSAVETSVIAGADHRIRTVGLPNGALQVARPLDEIDRVLQTLRNRTILLVVLVTAAAAALGLWIAGSVTASLRRLTSAATVVADTGRLDVSVPSGGNDEAGRLGVAFERMLAALARSRSDQQRLVQDAGHELRTPLTSIRTNLDVLRRHPDLPVVERTQIVDDLRSETEELVELVEEIVSAATGTVDDEAPESFSLGDLAREVGERFARRSGRELVIDVDVSRVVAQHAAVQRAVSNLLDNAHKFDDSDAPIELRVRHGSLTVLDRGPGIPPDELEHVFERFHRATAAQQMPGSGLGLSIVRDVVRRNGGDVRVSNREGGGAAVGFALPEV